MDSFSQELISAGFSEAIKVLTENLLTASWSRDKDSGKELLHQFHEEITREKYLSQHVASVLKIRTLHKSDYDTQLDKIYYPLTLYTASTGDKITVDNNVTIEHRGIINIIGIAGQGKSTILRKLFSEEIKKGKRIPFFIELRNVEIEDILKSYKNILNNIGLALDHDNGEMLLQSGKVVLMLDGFDEVKHDSRIKIMNSIRELNQRYNCPIIVTSRPNTQIHTESGIYNLYIEDLNLDDKLGILKVLSNDIEYSELSELIKTNISLQNTISNPILVTLLYYCYPYWDKVPSNTSEFYSKLFPTLYTRHDMLKGYARERRSHIEGNDSLRCFEGLCFFTLTSEAYDLNKGQLVEYTRQALKSFNLDENDSENLVSDIVDITCLIQMDGFDRFVFLHKSVQEYYAAQAMSKLPTPLKKDVYSDILECIFTRDSLDNMFGFLFSIDKESYKQYITIGFFESTGLADVARRGEKEMHYFIKNALSNTHINGVKKDNQIILDNKISLENTLKVSALPLMEGNIRTGDSDLQKIFTAQIELGINAAEIDNYRHTKKIMKQKYQTSKNSIEEKETIRYQLNLHDYLNDSMIYEDIFTLFKTKIVDYNTHVYEPTVQDAKDRLNSLTRFRLGR